MTAAPIRVARKGWFKAWLQPTRDQLRKACLWAETEARTSTWDEAADLVDWLNWAIGEQLGCHVVSKIVAWHDISDAPIIRIDIQDYTHHIAVRVHAAVVFLRHDCGWHGVWRNDARWPLRRVHALEAMPLQREVLRLVLGDRNVRTLGVRLTVVHEEIACSQIPHRCLHFFRSSRL